VDLCEFVQNSHSMWEGQGATRQGEVHGLQYKCGGVLMNKVIMFIMGYGLVVILRREDWNELTGHTKDRGKDSSNSGRILSNLGRMM
jgi:phosphoribosylaminoimidazole (AIR) synthetase